MTRQEPQNVAAAATPPWPLTNSMDVLNAPAPPVLELGSANQQLQSQPHAGGASLSMRSLAQTSASSASEDAARQPSSSSRELKPPPSSSSYSSRDLGHLGAIYEGKRALQTDQYMLSPASDHFKRTSLTLYQDDKKTTSSDPVLKRNTPPSSQEVLSLSSTSQNRPRRVASASQDRMVHISSASHTAPDRPSPISSSINTSSVRLALPSSFTSGANSAKSHERSSHPTRTRSTTSKNDTVSSSTTSAYTLRTYGYVQMEDALQRARSEISQQQRRPSSGASILSIAHMDTNSLTARRSSIDSPRTSPLRVSPRYTSPNGSNLQQLTPSPTMVSRALSARERDSAPVRQRPAWLSRCMCSCFIPPPGTT